MLKPDELKTIIKESETKTDGKLDIPKIQKFLSERLLSMKISFLSFYKLLMPELSSILIEINNSIQKENFFNNNENLNYFYKAFDIFFSLTHCCIIKEAVEIVNEGIMNDFIETFINMIFKIISLKEKNNDNNNFEINKFSDYIYGAFKVLSDININYIFKNIFLDSKNIFSFLLKQSFTRKIIYDILQKAISSNNKKELLNQKDVIINDIFNFLINENNNDNQTTFIQEIKSLSKIFKNDVIKIRILFLNLIKKILELYRTELNSEYEKLFAFFFNEIVFEENKENQYNKDFIDILFDIYKYLIDNSKKELYNIFLLKLFESINQDDNKEGKIQKKIAKKYSWLLLETGYNKIILETFPKVFDEKSFTFYLAILVNLSNENKIKDKNKEIFLPEIDLFFFFNNFNNYINNPNFDKEYLITFFSKKIYNLMNNNSQIIKIILNKCNAIKVIMKIIESEKNYNVKNKFFEFLEKILSINKGQFEYNLDIDIKANVEEINLKMNLISIGYEIDDNKYNEKLKKIIDIMNLCCTEKKINDFLKLINLIFTIVIDYQFNKINNILDNILLQFNNLLLQLSSLISNSQIDELTNDDKVLELYITEFLNSICKFIFKLNMKKFDYKSQVKSENTKNLYTKRIIEKKILKNIFKNLLLAKNNPFVKKITFEYLIYFCIDEKNNLILSSYYIYIIINIYYQDKNYKNLQKIFNILLNLIKNFELNGKILLNYDFVSITIDILQEIFVKDIKGKDEEECYNTAFLFLEEICKFLNHELLVKYLNKLFILFNKNVLSQISRKSINNENVENIPENDIGGAIDLYENDNNSCESYNSKDNGRENIGFNNTENIDLENIPDEFNDNERDMNNTNNESVNESKICLDLFNILKKYLNKNLENTYDFVNNNTRNYIVLSNHTFPNHLINNLLFIDDLKYNKLKDVCLYFRIVLKINTYEGMPEFILMQLRNEKIKLIFKINKNTLEIKEESPDHKITLYMLTNFDKVLPADNKYHNLIIIFEIDKKIINMTIDNNLVIEKSNQYNYFNFDSFNMIMGFKKNVVNESINNIDNKLSINKKEADTGKHSICYIYISYLLILNTSIIKEEDLVYTIKKERNYTPYINLLSNFYREKNRNWAKTIIAEFDFQNKNINLIYSKELKKNKVSDINKYISTNNNQCINQIISYIETSNSLNDDIRKTNLYMISKNKNINEYYSLNNFCELERINKSKINSKIFDNYDIIISFCNIYIVDFLIGFFFLIEKRLDEIKNKDNNINYKEQSNNKDKANHLNSLEDYELVNENLVNEYILEIFQILMLIPSQNIKNYIIKGDSKSNILKIKYFFYKNLYIIKDNDTIVEKILSIFSGAGKEKNEYLNKKIILIEILIEIFLNPIIFGKLNFPIQNTILLYINDLLKKTGYIKNDKKHNEYLLKLIKSLTKIVLFNKIRLDKDIDDNTQIDYIVDSINLIIIKSLPSDDKSYEEKLKNFFRKINNICINFSKDINNHITDEFHEKYNYIFSSTKNDDDYFDDNLDGVIEKFCNNIEIFYSLIKKNKIIESFLKDNNESKECNFCKYLKLIFYIKFKFVYGEMKFDKLYKRFFRNYYLNFGENSEIFANKNYAWYLSLKESYSKIQNKLFIKENNIQCFSVQNPKNKKVTNYYSYNFGKEYYKKKFKELYELEYIDKISKHKTLINSINTKKNQKNIYNCLIINKIHKILSIIILFDDSIHIFYNLCIDNNNKLKIAKIDTAHSLWAKNNKDFEKEFNEYLKMNEEEIKEEIYEIKLDDDEKLVKKNKDTSKFHYNKYYKFSKRIIYLNKINEIYKRQHLHISNALEIFLNNGQSYFLVFNQENRDIVFDQIITKINDLYKNKNNKIEIFKHSKLSNQYNKENSLYMKHCPILSFYQSQEAENFLKNQTKKGYISNICGYKLVMDGNTLKDEIYNEWCKNKISNYDYLMLLNIIAGRSFNDLSQYFIFPWIIHDFNKNILNWLSNSIYRDLSLPIHACGEDKERIINKYNLLDDEKYHSGTFYSTHSFVCYFLIRQRPFTEMHLEIQGAKFDAPSRMFNGVEQLSNLKEKYQEFIPALFNFPELYIKTNYIFDECENNKEPINDFVLPKWCINDPRKFTLIFKKLLESDKINRKLNSWIDLVFGYKQIGQNAIKSLNIYRNACYPFSSKAEFEKLEKNNELESLLYEKEELGCIGRQLFTKSHKPREINNENNKDKIIFFNDNDKLKNLEIYKIKNNLFDEIIKEKESKNDKSKISDIIFFPNSFSCSNKRKFYQGGISSLPTVMNSLREMYIKNFSNNINKKIISILEEEENFIILKNNYKYLNKLKLFLTYNKKCIELINFMENESYSYFLDEISDISCLTTNEKGTKLYVCFSNGVINQYKIIKILKKEAEDDPDILLPIFPSQLNQLSVEYKNIYFYKEIFKNFIVYDNDKIRICLKKKNTNNFTYNNPHIPKKIQIISLNEYHNVLIALDESNLLYIMSLNNNYKLMHISPFLSNIHYKMKEVIPLSWNGDFIIYSSYTIYLFSINGIPLCQLNLLEKSFEDLHSIVCCQAVFLYDIILFTSHKDGSIIIWKLNNKNITENSEERISYEFDRKKSKFFLPEYIYGYNSKHNRFINGKIGEYELQRKFEILSKIEAKEPKTYFCLMKMSFDMNYMVLLDNKKNLYILTNKEDNNKKSPFKIKSKDKCCNCNNKLIDSGIRPTLLNTNTFVGSFEISNFEALEFENENNSDKLICEECKQKLEHTENYLYNF